MMASVILFIMVSGALNVGYAYAAAFSLCCILYPLASRQRIKVNYLLKCEFLLLFAFSVSYFVLGGISFYSFKNYLTYPLAAYILGWTVYENLGQEQRLRDWVISITLGMSAYAALNYFINIGNFRYQLVDFWTGSFKAATGSGPLVTFITACIIYTLFLERRWWLKLLLSTMTVIALLYLLMLGTRTQFVTMIITAIISLALYAKETSGIRTMAKLLSIAFGVIIITLILFYTNVFDVRSYFENSNMVARILDGSIQYSNTARFDAFIKGFYALFEHPLGGQKEVGYYHNMWLDINRVAGLIPFITMVAYCITAWVDMLCIFRNKKIDIGLRYLLLSIYLSAFLNFAVEPIMEGLLYFFLSFCTINGMVGCLASGNVESGNSIEKYAPLDL